MAESSLCFPICSKFTTFLQNLCKVFGLMWAYFGNRTEILDSASAGVYVLFYHYLLFYLLRTRLKTNSLSDLEEIFSTFLKGALQFMTQQN